MSGRVPGGQVGRLDDLQSDRGRHGEHEELAEPEQPDAQHLARQQICRPYSGQQDLHDTAGRWSRHVGQRGRRGLTPMITAMGQIGVDQYPPGIGIRRLGPHATPVPVKLDERGLDQVLRCRPIPTQAVGQPLKHSGAGSEVVSKVSLPGCTSHWPHLRVSHHLLPSRVRGSS